MPSTSAPSETETVIDTVFNDGATAQSHPGTIWFELGNLLFKDSDGAVLCRWPLAEVHLVARPGDGQPVRLRRGFADSARVTLRMDRLPSSLESHCPYLHAAEATLRKTWKPLLFWASGAIASVALLFAVVIPWLGDRLTTLVPPAMERSLGVTVRGQIIDLLAGMEKRPPDKMRCRSESGDAALTELTNRLLTPNRVLAFRAHEFHQVEVIDSKMVNAFALPGGYILIMRGLLDMTQNVDELAGVLAHELGHVQKRHPLGVALERAGATAVIGLLLGDVAGGTVLAALGQVLIGASYGRVAEREADIMGIMIMQRAGALPVALAEFFERLTEKEGDLADSLGLFSTHPPSRERIVLLNTVDPPQTPVPLLSATQWQSLKNICRQSAR